MSDQKVRPFCYTDVTCPACDRYPGDVIRDGCKWTYMRGTYNKDGFPRHSTVPQTVRDCIGVGLSEGLKVKYPVIVCDGPIECSSCGASLQLRIELAVEYDGVRYEGIRRPRGRPKGTTKDAKPIVEGEVVTDGD